MDRRVKYTKKVIEDTFLNLLVKKDISNITVTEICEIADVNRGTFYRYYVDVYDLLHKIEQDFINQIKESPPIEQLGAHSIYIFTKGILSIFEKNKKLVRILFKPERNIYFLNEVLDLAYSKRTSNWSDPSIDSDELEYAVVFIFNGALGVINYWVKNDFSLDIDSLAKDIEQYCVNGAKKYIPRYQ